MKNKLNHFKKIVWIIPVMLLSCEIHNKDYVEYKMAKDSLIIKKEYHDDTLQSVITYQSDTVTKEGKAIFYKHGRLIEKMYYDSNRLVGSHLILGDSGDPEIYICHDSYGDTIFMRKYNKKRILFEKGSILAHGVLDDDNFPADSLIRYASFIVIPPYTKVWVNKYLVNLTTNDTLRPIDTAINYDWQHYYYFKIPSAGRYEYKQFTYLIDSIINDTKIIRMTKTDTFNIPENNARFK